MTRAYAEEDVLFFLRRGPYLALSTLSRAERRLRAEYAALVECSSALSGYPDLQVEPLEFWYATLRGLGALDVELLRALLQDCNWRGIVWGGWLALLSPQPEFEPLLSGVPANKHGNEWAARCALAYLRQREPEEPARRLAELAHQCRERLKVAKIVRMPLRLLPFGDELAARVSASEAVRNVYRARGAQEALITLRALGLREVSMPYAEWYRTTQGIRPRREFLALYTPDSSESECAGTSRRAGGQDA